MRSCRQNVLSAGLSKEVAGGPFELHAGVLLREPSFHIEALVKTWVALNLTESSKVVPA